MNAYQIAQQLVKQGEEVDLLAPMDTTVPRDVYLAEEEWKKLQAMEWGDK